MRFRVSLGAVSTRNMLEALLCWSVGADGLLRLDSRCLLAPGLPPMPRLGLRFFLPEAFGQVVYDGFGPTESYIDKHHACWRQRFASTAEGMHTDYIRPQENGSRCGCAEITLTNAKGEGLRVRGSDAFSFSASPYHTRGTGRQGTQYRTGEKRLHGAVPGRLPLRGGLGQLRASPAAPLYPAGGRNPLYLAVRPAARLIRLAIGLGSGGSFRPPHAFRL